MCLPFLLFARVNLPLDFLHLIMWCLLRHHHALKLVSLYWVLCNICADYVYNILTVLCLFIGVLLCTLNCILQQSCTCIFLWGSIKYSFIFICAIYLLLFLFLSCLIPNSLYSVTKKFLKLIDMTFKFKRSNWDLTTIWDLTKIDYV